MQLATAKHLEQQRARRDAFAAENLIRSARNRGVSYGGLVTPLLPIPSERDMVAAAEASARREAAFNASPAGSALEAVSAARAALRAALMKLEDVDRARSRDDGSMVKPADELVALCRAVLPAALDVALAAEAL